MSAQVTEAHLFLAEQLIQDTKLSSIAQFIADSEAKATVELKKQADHWCDMHTVCAKERDQLRAELEKVYALVTPDGCDLAPRGLFETTRAVTELRAEVEESKARERAAIASWDEERQRALREGGRVVELRAELALLREWQREVIQNANAHHAERKDAIARAERAEAELKASRYETVKAAQEGLRECIRAERAETELAGIRALADRRNKGDHSADTTHQLVAALDQALDIAQAELATERAKCNQLLSALVYADQILDDIDTCSDAHKPMYSSYSQNVFKLCIKGRDARRASIDAAMKEGA